MAPLAKAAVQFILLAFAEQIVLKQILNKCPNSVQACLYTGNRSCILRYSNISFFSNLETNPVSDYYNPNNITVNIEYFDVAWNNLMDTLIAEAASGSSNLKFAAGDTKMNLTFVQRIYAVVQCTPDLTETDCNNCLAEANINYQNCCHGKQGGYIHKPSCFFRWELYPFLKSSVYTSPPPAIREKGHISSQTIIGIVASILLFVLLLFAGSYVLLGKKSRKRYNAVNEENVEAATNNFSDDLKIGLGGFGHVYKGTLPDGQNIAVKRLSQHSSQAVEEFKNEVVLVAKLQHRNLVLDFASMGRRKY